MVVSKEILSIEARVKTDPFNPLHHIALAKAYLEEGMEDKARTIIATKRKLPSKDAHVHYEWGRLCEELGLARFSRESYEQAIALKPQESEYHFRLALLCHEAGAWERTLKHLEKTVALSPCHEEARRMFASLYREIGFSGSSDMVERKKPQTGVYPQTLPFKVTKEDADQLRELFGGREVGYAEFHLLETGKEGHIYRDAVLGFPEISDHVTGNRAIGVYLLRGDRTVKCCGIRILIPWRKLLANFKDSGFIAILEDRIHHYAKELKVRAKELGFPGYLDDCGSRGRRLWFFFQDFIPSEMAERFLNGVLERVASPGVDLAVEFLLGFKASGIERVDEPVMLPLGINRKTGRRCFFVEDEGTPYGDQFLLLKKVRLISAEEIRNFFRRPDRKGRKVEIQASDLFLKMQRRCPVLDAIVLKARSGRNLRIEEKLIVYFTVGFLPDGTERLHDILEACPDYRPNKVRRMVSRLGIHPVSCPKIRQLIPETTAYLPCKCSFDLEPGFYPTPVLHADPALVAPRRPRITSVTSLEELEMRHAFIVRKIENLSRERLELEQRLRDLRTDKSSI